MKRFVTYLYAYKDGEKMKNTGYIRVDVRGHILDMQVSVKETDLNNAKGLFYIVVKKEKISRIPLAEISMKAGQYNGRIICDCKEQEEGAFEVENIVGVRVCYENGGYMASCWRDGEEEIIVTEDFFVNETIDLEKIVEDSEDYKEEKVVIKNNICEEIDGKREEMQAASMDEYLVQFSDQTESTYRKINLNEIYILPSHAWHYSHNSFLIHGFWNYGYLVLKENMEENQKRTALGVPGIFEQPERIMATFFGFPEFEALPPQAMEMEIGQYCSCNQEQKEQQPQTGTFGCWFVNL